jgi:hypothetical protein
MEFVRGNLAIRDHTSDGRDLLLFEKVKQPGNYRFIGFFACDGFEYAMASDKKGSLRRVIIFQLRPAILGEEPEVERQCSSCEISPWTSSAVVQLKMLICNQTKNRPYEIILNVARASELMS